MQNSPRLFATLLTTTLLLSTSHGAESADPWRLTHEVVPLAQAVELMLDPAKDEFSGRTVIDLLATEPFSHFRLHAAGPAFTTATLTNTEGAKTSLAVAVTRADLGLVTLTAGEILPAGNYRLSIDFTAKYTRDGLGLYKTVSRGDAYLFTQFEDKHASKAFPCWDEPEFKINWQLTLTVPAALAAVSNTSVARETRNGETKTLIFGRTPPMPSYLVALAVGPLEFVPVPGLSVPGHIITPRGQSELTAEAVRLAPPLLTRLEEYFGIPHPYAKLDQVAVPEYVYGAMENAGLITYTDRALLMDPVRPSFSDRRRLANIMAHEMSHMWFGNLVTMRWWDDLWLNESFADWICTKVLEQQFPEFRVKIQQSRATKNAMRLDALPSISAMRRKVTATTDLAQLADALTYSKGKGILTMVENWIGPEQFRAAMRIHLLKHSWGSASATDLWETFSTVSGDKITHMLAAYVEKPGLPLVTLSIDPDGRLRLSQRRFTNLGDPQLPGQWQVPVVLAWGKDGRVHRERLLLAELTQSFDVPGLASADWVYPNAGEAGYYRWSLPPDFNARLARHSAALSPLERVGLLDNMSALFSAGLVASGDYLAYLTASGRDEDPDVASSVAGGIGDLRETFITARSATSYAAYRSAVLRPILDRIGLRPVPGEPDYLSSLRATLYGSLGYEADDPDVIAECRRLTALYLENPKSVDPSLVSVALSVAANHGDTALFESIQVAFEKAKSPSGRAALIGALRSFPDPVLVERALDYSLTPALNSTEFLRILLGIRSLSLFIEVQNLRQFSANWMMANYDAIAAKAPPEYLANLISVAGTSDPALFNRTRDFLLAPGRRTEHGEVNIAKAADRLTSVLRLRAKEQANIEQYLATFPGRILAN